MTVLHGIPDFITAQRFCKDTYATVTVTARITCMLVGRTHNTEFLTLLQSALNSTFPLAGTHVMQITVISLIAFCQSMAGIHLYKRGLVSFRKEVPIVSAIACLISHMMRSNKYLMPAGFPFPVFNGGTFHQRCVQVIIQSHMVAMFHAVRLITNKSQEFSFLIVFIGHGDIFLITSLSQTLEGTGMIIDHPLQTGIIRRIRPYELEKGAADAAFDRALDEVIEGMERSGLRGQATGFKRALAIMDAVPYDRSNPHPTVLIVGEYLLNFHLGANHEIERYLEDNGLEVIEARMTDVIRKTYFYKHAQSREFHVDLSLPEKAWYATADNLFELAHDRCDRLGAASPLYEPPTRMPELVRASDKILHHTFDAGEGVLIPAEILEHAKRGCRNFVILQPFGCLPNHVVGRGLIHALKEQYPTAQFLPLDYDPDVSFANVENRLQMLIMNAKAQGCGEAHGETA